MGWNIKNLKGPLYEKIENSYVYLVHSYYVPVTNLRFQLPTMV